MPSKPRFYNNQRPLNPRRAIIAPLGDLNTGKISVLSATLTGPKQITWVLDVSDPAAATASQLRVSDTAIQDYGSVSDLQDTLVDGDVSSVLLNKPHAGQMTIVIDYANTIDTDQNLWGVQVIGDGPNFSGRLMNPRQVGVIATP